jgi:hypothetical protein
MRTKYLENYQLAFATVLAAARLASEVPTIVDFVGAKFYCCTTCCPRAT